MQAKFEMCKKIEESTMGVTIGFLAEKNNTIIEAPLNAEKNFMTINNLML